MSPRLCVESYPVQSSHDCSASRISNEIIEYAEDTTVMGLNRKMGEAAHREGVSGVADNLVQVSEPATQSKHDKGDGDRLQEQQVGL